MYSQIARNKRNTSIILGLFLSFVLGIVSLFSFLSGFDLPTLSAFLLVSTVMSFSGYWFSDRIVLGLSGARPASRERDFHFYTVTENLCLAARLPMPKLYVIEDSALNAFATGRDPEHAVVCATTGLLQKLDRTELEGVVAHELAHVQNYDIRLMSVVAVLVGFIALLADVFLRFGGGSRRSRDEKGSAFVLFFILGILLALLSPVIAQLIQLAISRNREYLADATAVKLTRFPEGLARALEKLSRDKEPLEAANKATAHLYIVNPLKNHHDAIGLFAGLFSTHPPIPERVERLRAM